MPDTQSPFEIVTPSKPKKMGSKGLIVAFVVVLFLPVFLVLRLDLLFLFLVHSLSALFALLGEL